MWWWATPSNLESSRHIGSGSIGEPTRPSTAPVSGRASWHVWEASLSDCPTMSNGIGRFWCADQSAPAC